MPVPPAEGSIRLSPDGRLAMFDCRVQVLTENLARTSRGFSNAGARDPVVERMTAHFSEHFDLFESRFPVIRELHALCDIALAAQVARRMNAPQDLLTEFVNLPIRSAEVPATYAGLNIPIEIANVEVGAIQGGVNMVAAVTPAAVARVADPASERFAQQALAASGIARQSADAHPHYIASVLTTSLTGDTPLARAGGLIAGGSYDVALALLDDALAKDPDDISARRCRMRALAGRGLFHLAERELEIIAMLEDSPDIEDLRLKLHLDRGDPILLESIPADRHARLLSLYQNEAISQAAAGSYTKAIETAGRALALAPGDGALLGRRAQWELAGGDAAAAMADFQKAIDLSPRLGKPLVARAQAYERLGRLDDALRDANRALELDPSLSEAFCVRLDVAILTKNADMNAAYNDTRKVLALTPNDPMVYVYRAQILARQGDRDGALAAANRAVRLGPGIAQAYIVRGRLLAEQVRGLSNFANHAEQTENQDRFILALSDFNAAIGLRPDDGESHEMRAAALLDLAANVGEPSSASLDWQRLLTVALGAMMDSQRAGEVIGKAFGSMSPTDPNAVALAVGIKLGLLYAADDDLTIALAHVPSDARSEIQSLAAQTLQQIHAITGEPLR
jgi:tetratricopeptide (TPR) repeat protein